MGITSGAYEVDGAVIELEETGVVLHAHFPQGLNLEQTKLLGLASIHSMSSHCLSKKKARKSRMSNMWDRTTG